VSGRRQKLVRPRRLASGASAETRAAALGQRFSRTVFLLRHRDGARIGARWESPPCRVPEQQAVPWPRGRGATSARQRLGPLAADARGPGNMAHPRWHLPALGGPILAGRRSWRPPWSSAPGGWAARSQRARAQHLPQQQSQA
jgi:hypothetical protein